MAILPAAIVMPLGLLFFLSGLVVNAIQATCFVLIRPLSNNVYRRINRQVAELLWLELVFLVDWWARVQLEQVLHECQSSILDLVDKSKCSQILTHFGCLGFVSAVTNMRSFVPAIYDITVAIPKSSSQPTMLRLFKGQSSVVHVHIKRHKMKDLPGTDNAVAQWCKDAFIAKDDCWTSIKRRTLLAINIFRTLAGH